MVEIYSTHKTITNVHDQVLFISIDQHKSTTTKLEVWTIVTTVSHSHLEKTNKINPDITKSFKIFLCIFSAPKWPYHCIYSCDFQRGYPSPCFIPTMVKSIPCQSCLLRTWHTCWEDNPWACHFAGDWFIRVLLYLIEPS